MTLRVMDGDRDRFRESVAAAIRTARVDAGLSQRALAEQAKVSHAMIVSIEAGSALCSLWTASQIAHALDTTIDALAPVLISEPEED